jgi:hypothetical protein
MGNERDALARNGAGEQREAIDDPWDESMNVETIPQGAKDRSVKCCISEPV